MLQVTARVRNRILISLFVAAVALAMNWVYRYTAEQSVQTQVIYTDKMQNSNYLGASTQGQSNSESGFELGGWPFKYYYATVTEEPASATNWGALALNVAVWIGVLSLLLVYEALLHRGNRDESKGARSLSLADILLIITAVAGFLVYGRSVYQTGQQHLEVANQINAAGGSTTQVAYLPSILMDRVPESAMPAFMRLTRAEMIQPTSEQLESVLELGTVESLLLSGGSYDLRLLDGLPRQTRLNILRVAGRELDPAAVAAIGATKQLVMISLIYTNVTADGLNAWGDMPLLRSMDLSNTDVVLSDTNVPGWAKRLRGLTLPSIPGGGQQNVHGWTDLRYLSVYDFDTTWTSDVLAVSLKALPSFLGLSLDRGYMIDLQADECPQWRRLGAIGTGVEGVAKGQRAAKNTRAVRVAINGAESLGRITLDAGALEELQFKDVPNIEFELSLESYSESGYITYDRQRGYGVGGDIAVAKRQKWVDAFRSVEGLQRADLSGLSLKGVDLTPIGENQHLEEINFSDCELIARQVADLRGNKNLKRVDISGCRVSGTDAAKLLKLMPNLEGLVIDQAAVGRVRIRENPVIQSVVGRRVPGIVTSDAIHLEELPRFSDTMELAPGAQYFFASNTPSLRGIVFHSVMPEATNVEGLRDLEIFTGGGPHLTDVVVGEVLACEPLRKLTLAHANISMDLLEKIGERKQLSYLCLTGTPCNEPVATSLAQLSALKQLRIDQTGISEKQSLAIVERSKELQTLGLSDVSDDTAALLPKLGQLRKLWIEGSTVSPKLVESISQLRELQYLGFENCKISEEVAALLVGKAPDPLVELSLRGTEVEGDSLLRLASERGHLVWDVTYSSIEPEVMDFLMVNSRVRQDDEMGFAVMWGRQTVYQSETEYLDLGEVDPIWFSPDLNQTIQARGGFPRLQPSMFYQNGGY
ncbi:MAG: hypothetical protein AAGG44_02045 [Planctomycetota bacterium]